jgi:hypothetical protein
VRELKEASAEAVDSGICGEGHDGRL